MVSFTDSPTYGLAKESSFLLKPLIGKSKYHVKNSSDFASFTHEIHQTDKIMVSDPDLSQRTGLSTSSDLIKGLEICLNWTNFTFRGKYYKQVLEQQWAPPSHE